MRLVIVDEPGLPRDCLYRALTDARHDVRVARGVLDIRRLQKVFAPEICLVELVRDAGNGFTLAAFLQNRGAGEPVLLSDRNLDADRLWAHARGIRYVLSRSQGVDGLLRELEKIVGADV
jgi:DNA-binding response OmpR family regulator